MEPGSFDIFLQAMDFLPKNPTKEQTVTPEIVILSVIEKTQSPQALLGGLEL